MDDRIAFPQSTYRLQFHAGFTFRQAAAVVPYLAELGVSHCYASPYLKATPGSTHGYDVIDHCALNPEVGSPEDFEAWVETMRRHGMAGHVLDIVPNHVGVATNENKWWNDVLERGPASPYAKYFDIAWRGSPRAELHDKVLLPVLGDHYGQVLEKGELALRHADGKYFVYYYDRRFPVNPATAPREDPARALEAYRSPDRLDELLNRQHYRLAYWRAASDEINYRRFFDINDLAALAMEREEVFHAAHKFIFELVREGKVAGLRVDHPDGLYDPKQYFDRLRERAKREVGRPVYVVAEKILAMGEELPRDWAVHGTSGYDFLNMVNGLFVDEANEGAFTRLYDEWTGDDTSFDELVYRKKRLILKTSLASELQMLTHRLDRIAQSNRHTRDFTHNALRQALREVIACFPVYRSYVTAPGVSETDRRHVELAVARAIGRNPKVEASVFQFVGDAVLQNYPGAVEFAGRFQQLTAPATAKGVEDTAFYCYHRLISLNEVGGEPGHFGVGPDALHAYLRRRQANWPHSMSALSTHDTKRSEDVRARINVLSEIPDQWRERAMRWREINAAGQASPAPDEEYLLYQTLVGAWPLDPAEAASHQFLERIQAYMTKAMREAKLRTSWVSPNEEHEGAVKEFISRILGSREFLNDFLPFQRRISHFGMLNSLSQTLLRLAAPGVPDTYQGTEVWDLSLVDPDNRRPVEYERRRHMLDRLRAEAQKDGPAAVARHVVSRMNTGEVKMYATWRALHARRNSPELFSAGDYLPGAAAGSRAQQVFAFGRRHHGHLAVVIVPRLITHLADENRLPIARDVWGDTALRFPELPGRIELRNAFTGEAVAPGESGIPVAEALASFPVALLISD